MPLATLIHRSSLSCPEVNSAQAHLLLVQYYGLSGALKELGSQQDRNYLVDCGAARYVLKICHGDYSIAELQAQHAALAHLAAVRGIRVPGVFLALDGAQL